MAAKMWEMLWFCIARPMLCLCESNNGSKQVNIWLEVVQPVIVVWPIRGLVAAVIWCSHCGWYSVLPANEISPLRQYLVERVQYWGFCSQYCNMVYYRYMLVSIIAALCGQKKLLSMMQPMMQPWGINKPTQLKLSFSIVFREIYSKKRWRLYLCECTAGQTSITPKNIWWKVKDMYMYVEPLKALT